MAPGRPGEALPRGAALASCPGDRSELQDVAAACRVLLLADVGDARYFEAGQRFGMDAASNLTGSCARSADGLDGIEQVEDQLSPLPSGDVGTRLGVIRGRTEGLGDRGGDLVGAGRPSPDVQQTGDRRRVGLDDTGGEMGGGGHHADAVDVARTAGGPSARFRRRSGHRRPAGRGGATAASADTAGPVSWLFMVRRTTSSS